VVGILRKLFIKYSSQAAYFGKWWRILRKLLIEKVFDPGHLLW